MVVDKREPGGYITPIEAVGEYATYVSRIRQDSTSRTDCRCGWSVDNCARVRR